MSSITRRVATNVDYTQDNQPAQIRFKSGKSRPAPRVIDALSHESDDHQEQDLVTRRQQSELPANFIFGENGSEHSNNSTILEDTQNSESNNDSTNNLDSDNSSDDDDSSDLDDLLKKAELALLERQNDNINLWNNKTTMIKFPKLQPGVSIDDELYIKSQKGGIARLKPQSVVVVESSEPVNKKALVSIQRIKQETRPLTRREREQERQKTTGKGWFDMPLATMTPELKRDLQILKMRHVLDRKRHYKKMAKGPDPKYLQMGTIIHGPTEYFSSRINKKDRKRTFAEELLSNEEYTSYYHRKYLETQDRKTAGGKKHYKKLKARRY